jgi:hypothetical protein
MMIKKEERKIEGRREKRGIQERREKKRGIQERRA